MYCSVERNVLRTLQYWTTGLFKAVNSFMFILSLLRRRRKRSNRLLSPNPVCGDRLPKFCTHDSSLKSQNLIPGSSSSAKWPVAINDIRNLTKERQKRQPCMSSRLSLANDGRCLRSDSEPGYTEGNHTIAGSHNFLKDFLVHRARASVRVDRGKDMHPSWACIPSHCKLWPSESHSGRHRGKGLTSLLL